MNAKPLNWLLNYLKLYIKDILIVIAALVSVSLSMLMLGSAIKYLIDEGLRQNISHIINQAILAICLLIIIFGISSFYRSYFINNLTEKIINIIKIEAYTNLLQREIGYFEEMKIGDTISRLTTDLEYIAKLIINFLSFFLRNLIMMMGAIILMFFQSYKLSLIILIAVPLLFIPLLKLGKYVRVLAKNALTSQGEIASDIAETFQNVRTIYAFNQQDNKILEFKKHSHDYLIHASSRLKIRSLFFAIAISIILSTITLVLWIGSIDIIEGKMTSGQMVTFTYYSIIAGMSGGGIAELLSDIHSPLSALERVFELFNIQSISSHSTHRNNTENLNLITNINNSSRPILEFKNVSFFYPSRKDINIINNISLQIKDHNFIGIVGRSGAGKSTIMQLILKFYDLTTGKILINHQDISQIDSKSLRSLIAYVPQEPSIFSGTIRSNIAFACPEASDKEIVKVAHMVGIIDFAKSFKNGLDTEVGQRGVKLSGGQKQRIAIARALIYHPQILLLDEATSSLDSESEQKILVAIRELMKEKVIIAIAHRISCLEQADEILIINKGILTDKGTHKDLMKKSAIYKTLCEEQLII